MRHGLIFQFRFLILKCMTTIKSHGASKPKTSLWKNVLQFSLNWEWNVNFATQENPLESWHVVKKIRTHFFWKIDFYFQQTTPFVKSRWHTKCSKAISLYDNDFENLSLREAPFGWQPQKLFASTTNQLIDKNNGGTSRRNVHDKALIMAS